ncbi:MAG: hypothetical protein QM488_04240 [Rhizobiaceae bacterium]
MGEKLSKSILPDCMALDGAEPCAAYRVTFNAYTAIYEKMERLEIERQKGTLESYVKSDHDGLKEPKPLPFTNTEPVEALRENDIEEALYQAFDEGRLFGHMEDA